MHPVYLLAVVTLVAVLGFLSWAYISHRRNHLTGGNTTGIGGPNDPLAGNNKQIRDPDVLRASLDAAHDRASGVRHVDATGNGA